MREIINYHNHTKHHFNHYAPGPGYLDWATQPDPFRRYDGARVVALEKAPPRERPRFDDVTVAAAGISVEELSVASLSRFLFESLAISAWKQAGESRWSLRVNPSSGNLHPTEAYVIAGPVAGISADAFVAHYAPETHALEIRAEFQKTIWEELFDQRRPLFLVGLSSIYWREAWKYGERAFRYCQHDLGHAIAALSMAAAANGWDLRLRDALGREDLKTLLGLSKVSEKEREAPECLLVVSKRMDATQMADIRQETITAFESFDWQGRENALSPNHVFWPALARVAEITAKPRTKEPEKWAVAAQAHETAAVLERKVSFGQLVRQRRSAVAMDGHTGMAQNDFYHLLLKTVMIEKGTPFPAIWWQPRVHLVLFVHRVTGLTPGIYFLIRNQEALPLFQKEFRSEFVWEKASGTPQGLRLYQLLTGDARLLAAEVSCGQNIAADGALSVGMLAAFDQPLAAYGAWFYPRLYWECGMIGQVLYLEAEAMGLRGTGIGCFFDDAVHEVLGLKDTTFQSLYHFTIGGPVEDPRIKTYGDTLPLKD